MVKIPETKQQLPIRGVSGSPNQWLKAKANYDRELWHIKPQQKNVWIVDNKKYDLTNFVKLHPGGENWIKFTKGHDITQHFHIHHLNQEKARNVLNKYYIGECEKKQYRYTFADSGLYQTVKRRVLEKYTPQQLQQNSQSKSIAKYLVFLWISFFIMAGFYKSFICASICGYLLLGITGIGHNFIHQKPTIYRFFYSFTGFTHIQWEIMHCLSHHIYTNTLLDYELGGVEPIVYYHKCKPKNSKISRWLMKLLFILIVPFNILFKVIINPLFKLTKPEFLFGVCLIQIPILYLINGDLPTSINLFLCIHLVFGYIFYRMVLCQHRVPQLWTQGQPQIKDYGQHILATTLDNTPQMNGVWSFIIHSGFSKHIAHHFFPTVDHSQQGKLFSIIRQTAKQYGVKYRIKTMKQCQRLVEQNYTTRIPFTSKQ